VETPLLSGALASNEIHKRWMKLAVGRLLESAPRPARVVILGLTYKPGTDTLRRSEGVSLGLWLIEQGAEVTFHDPVVTSLPEELTGKFRLTADIGTAVTGADLLIVATGWSEYRELIGPQLLRELMRRPAVIDQNRFLASAIDNAPGIAYVAVGNPQHQDK
jgi:UDPglucose 6-dehydrogenase